MLLHAFSSNGFKIPGGFSQPSCPWPDARNEDCSSETCGTTFMLKWLYKLIQILNWKDHSYIWKGSDLSRQHPSKCSIKTWNFLSITGPNSDGFNDFWVAFSENLAEVQRLRCWVRSILVKVSMAASRTEFAPDAQPLGMAVCSPQVTHAAYLHLARVRTPNWIYMIAQCRKMPLQKDLGPNFTHKCIYATCTYTSESHVFITQGRKSTPDDPSSPCFVAYAYKVIMVQQVLCLTEYKVSADSL